MKRILQTLHANRDGIVLAVAFMAALVAVQLNDDHAMVHNPQIARAQP